MSSDRSCVLAARWILPVSSPPINGGWIRIVKGRIREVQAGSPPSDARDLGDVAILPRLINAHTHLEFSEFQRPIGEPGISLARWIGLVVASRGASSDADRQRAIERGLAEMWDSGTVLAGEITTPPCDYPDSAAAPDLVTFAEVLGLSSGRSEERLQAAIGHLQKSTGAGLSPHAPYSLSQQGLAETIAIARRERRSLAMHVAESPEERELLTRGTGPLAEALTSLGVWRDGLFPWGTDPFGSLIDQLATVPSTLLIHGNDLNDAELAHLQQHRNVTVVYCPRTHDFFRFPRHPVDRMLAAQIRVALGTDSRASNPDLNLWREVQFLLRHRADLDPTEVIRMATQNGAEALGNANWGTLDAGKLASMGCVRTEASSVDQLFADLSAGDYQPLPADA